MTRYWVSWWSGYYKSEGCSEPPFQIWTSGERSRHDGKTELSLCAVIDAENVATPVTLRSFEATRFCENVPKPADKPASVEVAVMFNDFAPTIFSENVPNPADTPTRVDVPVTPSVESRVNAPLNLPVEEAKIEVTVRFDAMVVEPVPSEPVIRPLKESIASVAE